MKDACDCTNLNGKKIIFVLGSLELGGAERQALLLGRHLVGQGAKVEVWGLEGEPGRAAELCDEAGLTWRLVPTPWGVPVRQRLLGILNFARELRRARPQVVLPYTMYPNVLCGAVWRSSGARLCIWNQRDEGRGRVSGRIRHWFEQKAVRQTPRFISNSQHGADFLQETFGVASAQITVVRNGVQLAAPLQSREEWRQELGVDDDCLLACMVANVHYYKDHPTLLRAWRRVLDSLQQENRQAVLLLAGRLDDAGDEVKALAFDLELRQSVRFLGGVKDIAGLLQAVDFGVFSSRFEGVPNGVLESMASGLAVAATDIPGIREAVGPEGYEFLAPPGDDEALAEKILWLARNEETRTAVGQGNRNRVEMEYTPQGMCEITTELISKGLG